MRPTAPAPYLSLFLCSEDEGSNRSVHKPLIEEYRRQDQTSPTLIPRAGGGQARRTPHTARGCQPSFLTSIAFFSQIDEYLPRVSGNTNNFAINFVTLFSLTPPSSISACFGHDVRCPTHPRAFDRNYSSAAVDGKAPVCC